MYIYMLAIASQTAGPNGLNLYKETHGYPEGNIGQKFEIYILFKI